MTRKYNRSGKYNKKHRLSAKERYTKQIEGMVEGVKKAHEARSGWPKWKKGTFEELIEASGKRFDDPYLYKGKPH